MVALMTAAAYSGSELLTLSPAAYRLAHAQRQGLGMIRNDALFRVRSTCRGSRSWASCQAWTSWRRR